MTSSLFLLLDLIAITIFLAFVLKLKLYLLGEAAEIDISAHRDLTMGRFPLLYI